MGDFKVGVSVGVYCTKCTLNTGVHTNFEITHWIPPLACSRVDVTVKMTPSKYCFDDFYGRHTSIFLRDLGIVAKHKNI
jgi:hypothetical protein